MDCDQYYLKARNKYTLHFANSKGLSVEEIRNIFSIFGNIVGITTTGDLHGYRFVSYASLKETINCIQNIRYHEFIKLLPERSKLKQNKDKQDQQMKENHNLKNDRTRSKNFDAQKNRDRRNSNVVPWDNESVESGQEVVNRVTNYDEDFGCIERMKKYAEISSINEKSDKLSMKPNIVSKIENDSLNDCRYMNSPRHSEKSFKKDNGKNNDREIPSLISTNTLARDTSIESLDKISSCAHSVTESKIVLAQHVVVANVHKDFGIHYILHLFEDYDPIAVSLMKTTHGTKIRYCHVYFKNRQDAFEVEKIFDKFVIHDEPLIVLRIHRLLEEVSIE